MKKTLFLLIAIIMAGCSADESSTKSEVDLMVFNSTTFVSETYEAEVEIFTGYGIEVETQSRRDVVRFKADGRVINFRVNGSDRITYISPVEGYYKLDYPRVHNISGVVVLEAEEINIQKDSEGLYFMADGKRFNSELTTFRE